MKVLDIGPGEHPLPGADVMDCSGANYARLRMSLPYEIEMFHCAWGDGEIPCMMAERYDLIYASHVLEHIPWFKTLDALREARHMLKPGGTLEVWVPNFAYLVACYRERICGDKWRHENPTSDPMVWLNGRIFTYGPEPNWHHAVFDQAYLGHCLREAGFVDIANLDKPRGYDHGAINLGMSGRRTECAL